MIRREYTHIRGQQPQDELLTVLIVSCIKGLEAYLRANIGQEGDALLQSLVDDVVVGMHHAALQEVVDFEGHRVGASVLLFEFQVLRVGVLRRHFVAARAAPVGDAVTIALWRDQTAVILAREGALGVREATLH